MSEGLGLSDFLNDRSGGGGGVSRRKELKAWSGRGKDNQIDVWLHPRAKFYPTFRRTFPRLVEYERDGKVERFLAWERWVSFDPKVVDENQNDYDEATGRRKYPPVRDPFGILKDWLRTAKHLDMDEPIFQWVDPKPNGQGTIVWTRKELAGFGERGRGNFGHTLDARLEWLFTVVVHDQPAAGAQLTWEKKSLGDKVKEAIRKRMESLGDDRGNPLVHPCCLRWKYNPGATSFNDYYDAFFVERIEPTAQVREALMSDEIPDGGSASAASDDDLVKIRASMEEAAQVDLPFDLLFPGVSGREEFDDAKREKPASSSGPRTRRRRAAEEPPPKKPDVPEEPCEKCGTPFPVNQTKCPKCGARYEVDAGDEPDDATPAKGEGWNLKGDGSGDDEPAKAETECWACAKPYTGDEKACGRCGAKRGDKVPF